MRKKKPPEHVNHERWLVSYADFITLLFAFFVVMFAVSKVDSGKVGRFSQSFSVALGLPFANTAGQGVMPGAPTLASHGNNDPGTPSELAAAETRLRKLKGGDLAKVTIIRQGNEIVLRFAEAATFSSGDDRLKESAVRAIRAIADELRERRVNLRVEGHTDNIPISNARFRSNWDLSTSRASSVVAELLGPGRIPPQRLAAAGYAEFHPIASNETAELRTLNRRVDVVVTEMPKSEPARGEPAKSESPGGEPPKNDAPTSDPPRSDPPRSDPPRSTPPKSSPPRIDPLAIEPTR